jgi:hypothetical protein
VGSPRTRGARGPAVRFLPLGRECVATGQFFACSTTAPQVCHDEGASGNLIRISLSS